jgi:hypothetical protein
MPREEGIRSSAWIVRQHSLWFFESLHSGALGFPGFPEYPWRSTVQVAGRLVRQQQRRIAHMVRAMARRCSCPPESCLGNPSRSLEHASTMLRASGLNCQTFDLREMVAVSARQQLQGHSWTARLPFNVSQAFTCSKRRKPRSAFQSTVFPGRCTMSGEAIELSPLPQNHQQLRGWVDEEVMFHSLLRSGRFEDARS